ncbi:MAG: hypothetical protein QOG60_2406, partial [Frankiaceae bacterium]|nr:hypothetical protein [Frankiaceae bacterium]
MSARNASRAVGVAVVAVAVLLALAACGSNRSAPSSPVRPAASARPAAPANAWTVPVRAGAAATADRGTLVARLARSGPPVALL